ncbi:phosphonate ABC transporter, permease protein PhnE [Undibacterium sp.]|jgi:phosphonate transport system permease protein|uniref:phosphonate ABC transporter, permease protein PhnE n=1 Tax=Undibacterium sp. TaxID=1914977 RepID=UPI002C9CEB7F|nr:phosphonate ABC transporter, permease protein PhnE [Undibacterium sp.]HTD03084.1 phosphonate ABC transporter, permease protein PhnE [Undibacterium sp.]
MSDDILPKAPPVVSLPALLALLGILALTVASFISLAIDWRSLFSAESLSSTWKFFQEFAPVNTTSPLLQKVLYASLETLAMSALGTGIAAACGIAMALPASGRFGKSALYASRLLLNIARAIPELVWASIMLIAAGLGPFAGTIALAAHTTGVLGRLFAEALENASPLPETTLRINGAGAITAFLYATLPQRLPQMLSYTLYRWENNIRAAAILGVVGAGGLGQMLKYHLSLFQMQTAATVIIAMLLLVAMVDGLSFAIRRWLVN